MSLSNLKKDELKILCSELDISFSPSSKVVELITLIENSKIYKENIDVVKNAIIEVTDEKRKKTEQAENERILNEQKLEIEKLSLLRLDKELELLKLKSASVESKSLNHDVSNFNLENLIKSVKILTIPVPKNVECFNLFFNSLEKAFKTKGVSDEFKAEILLNILGERIGNLMIYVKEEELGDYEKIKSIVLREFQPTPQECLKQFKSAVKLPTENYVQFASRVSSVFEYYIQLRKVKEFSKLCELMVSDQIFNSIPQDLKNHISIKQGESFFTPQELGRECDLFLASKTGSRAEHSSFSRSIVHNDRRKFGKVNFEDRSNKNNSRVFLSNVNSKCIMCHNSHSIFKCEDFKKLPVSDRVGFVKDNNLCFKCLSPNCSAKKCSARNCFCNKPHNKLLHFQRVYDRTVENIERETSATTRKGEEPKSTLNAESSAFYPSCSVANEAVQSSFSATSTLENKLKRTVLLSTAKFFIRDKNGDLISVRGLLDAGSQSDIMTKECANKLGLKQEKINVIISCLNNSAMTINKFVKAEILNVDKSFNQEFEFLVVDKITDLTPSRCLNVEGQIPSNIKLADNFMVPQKIDCLLGAKWFYHLLRPEKIYMPHSELFFQNSVFGFLASGSVMELNNQKVHCGLIIDDDLNSTMRKFWEVESVELETPKSEEAKFAEEHFVQTHFRDPSGKYVVTIPLKEEPNCLGESRSIALKRLKSVWFKLSRDQNYLNLYKDFINEYERLGHMRDVTHEAEPDISYYMPHHGVYRPEKTSTKLRVVFNASSETTNGTSFNSLQLNGGVVQEDLISIMMRFRKHPFAFTADIEKMYRMIDIHPSQRSLQRIVWKDSELSPVKTFELSTITYGTVSAPFLATRTLIQLAKDEGHNFPLAAPIVKDDFYVDDVLSGAKTLPECIEIQHQLTSLLKRAGMRLHKWCGSHPQLASASGGSYEFSSGETKTLGVIWNSTDDCFCFKVSKTSSVTHTKRTVLSTIAKLFDPLGLLGPVISKAKIFLQKLWLLNLQWDDHLPAEVFEEWDRFFKELQSICYIKINRCILPFSDTQIIKLHRFSDASEAAFGAVVYCKSLSSTGDVSINLVASKSRVAPLKKITVPRLELCAAVLLAKLIRRIKSALRLEECKTYYWSNSMIVLSWIKKQPSLLKTFVANRVATIQDLSCHEQWRHVSSEDNPADLISRGVNPSNMLDSHLWWEGPVFLTYGKKEGKRITYRPMDLEALEEARKEREKEVKMYSVMKEVAAYFFFLWIVMILSYGNRDPNNFYLREALINGFIKPGDLWVDYNFVNTETKFWNWTHNALLPELFAMQWYNNRDPLGLRLFLDDRNNLKISYGVLRQVRIKPRSCKVSFLLESVTPECAGFGSVVFEDGTLYTKGWRVVNSTDTLVPPEYKYLSASQLKGYPFWGQMDWYGGGGYVVALVSRRDSDIEELKQKVKRLEVDGWIDRHTRAVFVEFGVYNAQINLFCSVTILAEFLPGGGVVPYYHIDPVRLLNYHTGFGLFQMIIEITFVLFTIFFTYKEIKKICREGCAYFKEYWNVAELISVIVSYTGIANQIYKLFMTAEILRIFTETEGTGYVKLQEAVLLNDLLCYQIGLIMSISTLKFLKLLRFNKRIGMLSSTLRMCAKELKSYAVCLMVVFIAFVILFWLLLGRFVREFSTFVYSFESSISMMLKKFNYEDMYQAQPIFTPIAFFTFSLATAVVLINILLSIIIRSFEDVKHDESLQSNEYEILDFFINRMKMTLGCGTAKVRPQPSMYREEKKPKDTVSSFPDKVDKLVDFINNFYFENQMDFNSKDFLKKMNADIARANGVADRERKKAKPVKAKRSRIPKTVSDRFDDF